MSLTNPTRSWSTPAVQLALMIGQIFFASIGLAWWNVVGNALFVTTWGAERMPWVFLLFALCGPIISYGAIALQRKWSTARVVLIIVSGLTACGFLLWLGLLTALAAWVSLLLLTTFYISAQMTYIIAGALTGRLFDMRQMKRYFPQISAASSLGFIAGSIAVPLLLTRLGGPTNLLIGVGISFLLSLFLIVLLILTNRSTLSSPVRKTNTPQQPLLQLLRQRYVARAFGFQAMTTVNSCFIFYTFAAVAATQFTTADSLASFFGIHVAVRNGLTVLIALVAVGWLFQRFGLALGLANAPGLIGVLVACIGVGALVMGLGNPLVFWLAAGTTVIFVNLNDSMIIPSLKMVYQAMPPQERQVMETAVEGIGAPLASGAAGMTLLVLVSIPGVTLLHLVFLNLFLTVVWLISGVLVYQDYAATLLRNLSQRKLGETELSLNASSSLAVVERLLHSANVGEVRLALDLLEQANHPTLPAHLMALVEHGAAAVQVEALLRIANQQVQSVLPAVEACLQSAAPPEVHGAALRALCALTTADPVEVAAPFLTDAAPAVRLGAMTGLLRDGGIAGILRVGEQLTTLTHAAEPTQRALAAQVIGEVGVNNFYQPLLPLLVDDDITVRQAALLAGQRVVHPRLLPLLVENLAQPATRSAAIAALAASGELVLPLVEQGLAAATNGEVDTARRLVRVCAQIKGPAAIALLKRHLNHPTSELQSQVLQTLQRCGYRAQGEERAQVETALLDCVRRGLLLLLAQREIGETPATAALSAALAEELRGVRQRVFLLLAFCYDARAILRAAEHLERGASAVQAQAIETLDVTLTSAEKALVLPLVDESRPVAQRQAALRQRFPLPALDQTARLEEIICDATTWSLPWTRACAIYAAGKLGLHELTGALQTALDDEDPVIHETAIWALASLKHFSVARTESRRDNHTGFMAAASPVPVS